MNRIFSPTKILNLTLNNRLIALPIFTGYGLPDSRVSPLMLEHYSRLGKSGAAVVTVPNVAVSENGRTSERSLLLNHDRYIKGLSRLANVIKQGGALACIQLNHGGRYAVTDQPMLPSSMDASEIALNFSTLKNFMESFPFGKRFELTAHLAKMSAGWFHQMTDSEVVNIISCFRDAALRSFRAGFDMIELHGASGYLIAQFLLATTNKRKSPWGGSGKARMQFALSIVDEIRNILPKDFPIGFRLILDEKIKNGFDIQDAIIFAQRLEQRGIAYLSATIGTYQSMFIPKIGKEMSKAGYLSDITRTLRNNVKTPVIISGRIVSPIIADKILQNGDADLIGLGRPLLVDSDWIRKTKSDEKIIKCKNCSTCFKNLVLGESVICERWPKIVHDRIKLENRFTSRNSYRVLVIYSSISDLEIAKWHILNKIPINSEIINRQIFIDTGEEVGFARAARTFASWSEQYLCNSMKRYNVENFFVDDPHDPVALIMEHLEEDFGYVIFMHDEKSEWKKQLLLKVPADVVVRKNTIHPNLNKVLIPCDLSTSTFMQIRIISHSILGRSNMEFQFCHVADSAEDATKKWSKMVENYEMVKSINLKIIKPEKGRSVADTLIKEVKDGNYGILIISRRGGFAQVRRRILGSVSAHLLQELPDRTFSIVG